MKFLVILFLIKLYARKNAFDKIYYIVEKKGKEILKENIPNKVYQSQEIKFISASLFLSYTWNKSSK